MIDRPPPEEISLLPDPMDVLKWSAVLFVVCLEVLIVVAAARLVVGVWA